MLRVIENCCDLQYLEMMKGVAETSETWNLKHPLGFPFKDKHLKLDIIENDPVHDLLAGMAMGLLIQIYNSKTEGGQFASDFFLPEVSYCAISVKDKHRQDNPHTDHEKDLDYIKIMGLLNSNWQPKDGGEFIHGEETVFMKPTSFVVFDPRITHCAAPIKSHEKRFGIDFTVRGKRK